MPKKKISVNFTFPLKINSWDSASRSVRKLMIYNRWYWNWQWNLLHDSLWNKWWLHFQEKLCKVIRRAEKADIISYEILTWLQSEFPNSYCRGKKNKEIDKNFQSK